MRLRLILLACAILLSGVIDAKCVRKDIQERFKQSSKNIEQQISDVEKLLQGSDSETLSMSNLFGHNFKLADTSKKIKELEEIVSSKNGIGIENEGLVTCLEQLNLIAQLEKLQVLSSRYQKLKIEVLRKNEILNDSLRQDKLTESSLPGLKKEILEESSVARNEKFELENQLLKNESEATKEQDNRKKELLAFTKELTKVKIEILNEKIETNSNLEKKINYFEGSMSRLKALSSHLDKSGEKELIEKFEEIEKLWLSLLGEKYYGLLKDRGQLDLPSIPQLAKIDEYKDYQNELGAATKLREEVMTLKKEVLAEFTEKKTKELKLLNQLVTSCNSLRSGYFEKLGATYFFSRFFSLDFFNLLKNELFSSPYRILSYFYGKYLLIREKISLGREGVIYLVKLFFSILMAFGLYLTLKMLFARFNPFVDRHLQRILYTYKGSNLIKSFFSLWNKVKDNSKYFLWLLVLFLITEYFPTDDLYLVLKVFQVYLFSQILKSVVTLFLGSVSRLDSGNFLVFKKKSSETSDRFKNIFLFYYFTMIFNEATIGRVYLFTLLNFLVFIYSLYYLVKESARWENEFRIYCEKMFAGVIVEKYFKVISVLPQLLHATLILFFILVLQVFNFVISYTERFDFSKKISANLFKKQIENIEAEEGASQKLPQDYKDRFSLKSLANEDEYVRTANDVEGKILEEVKEWNESKSGEHSLVLYGNKGVGKTTLLKKVASEIGDEASLDVDVKYIKLPSKTITKDALYEFIDSIFMENKREGNFDIYQHDRALEKRTIVVIDETQNIFLSQTNGFEAYYALINTINLNTQNIFWVMAFNKYSWLYLDRAFGRTQYFRNVYEIVGWNDVKIKEMIMRRHTKSEFKLSYDLLINATRSQDEIDRYASIESKFFKLLWELSRGNPRSALYLWMSALSRKGKNVLTVNIPKEADLVGFGKLPDDLMFVIAEVLKHENLLSSEIETTTNLPKGIIRNAIKIGLENKFFYKDERHRYMVDISTQFGLIRYLKLKNFIYGN